MDETTMWLAGERVAEARRRADNERLVRSSRRTTERHPLLRRLWGDRA